MKKPKLKKPSRKFVLIEVETTVTNAMLKQLTKMFFCDSADGDAGRAIQVHVNAAKKEKAK